MALFHLNVKQIKRSQGQSAIASAAYRAGEKLSSEYYGEIADYVDAPDKSSGKRRQNIHIKYDGIGFIPLSELMQKETA